MCPTRSPGAIADLFADAYRTALRVLGVSRPDKGSKSLNCQLIYSGLTLCPRSEWGKGEGGPSKCHHPHGNVPGWLFRTCRLSVGANERLMSQGVFYRPNRASTELCSSSIGQVRSQAFSALRLSLAFCHHVTFFGTPPRSYPLVRAHGSRFRIRLFRPGLMIP